MVEFKEVLHVSEDDVLLVNDARRNLLDSARHLPKVSLHEGKKNKNINPPQKKRYICINFLAKQQGSVKPNSRPCTPEDLVRRPFPSELARP